MPRLIMIINRKAKKNFWLLWGAFFLTFLLISPVNAHHPWDGAGELQSFNVFQGLLSGLAHPILGFDHLIFLVAIGLAGLATSIEKVLLLVGIGLTGTMVSQFFPIFPGSELTIALSIVLAGLVSFGWLHKLSIIPLLFCHGYVLGNAMVGLESTPLAGYFAGLFIIQSILVILGIEIAKRFWQQRLVFSTCLLGIGITITTFTIF